MQVWITTTTHLKRQTYLANFVTQCKENWYEISLSVDDWSLWIFENKRRCFLEVLNRWIEKNDNVLRCEDDVELCKWFDNYLKQLPDDYIFYCLFTRQWQLVNRSEYKEVWKMKIYDTPINKRYEHTIYVPKNNVKKALEIYEDFLKELPNLQEKYKTKSAHPDYMIYYYLKDKWIHYWIVLPSLVDHVWHYSALWHNIGNAFLYMNNA